MLLQISVVQRMKANHNRGKSFEGRVELLQISVVQRMKANHNAAYNSAAGDSVVANISCSKNESKSQRYALAISEHAGCCKYQLFKE